MSGKKNITEQTSVIKGDEVVSSIMDNETIMMSIENGEYYGINPVGSQIWEQIKTPRKVADICKIMCREFNVEPEQCRRDVVNFLNQMVEKGIIAIADE